MKANIVFLFVGNTIILGDKILDKLTGMYFYFLRQSLILN